MSFNHLFSLNRKIKIFILLVLTSHPLLFSRQIESLIIEFNREYLSLGAQIEKTRGIIYYENPDKCIVKVSEPINQWMILEDSSMQLFYPDEKRAFQIIHNSFSSASLHFFQYIINSTKEDFGLSELGYTLKDYSAEEDSLYSTWNPPKELSTMLGTAFLIFRNNNIIEFGQKDLKGEIISRTTFENHIKYGLTNFPLKVKIIKTTIDTVSTDIVVFSSPKINGKIPEEILNFKIPESVNVETIIWQ